MYHHYTCRTIKYVNVSVQDDVALNAGAYHAKQSGSKIEPMVSGLTISVTREEK